MATKQMNSTVFTLCQRGIRDSYNYSQVTEVWDPRFSFHAKDENEAQHLAFRWAQYQGFNPREVKALPAEGRWLEDGFISNNFVNRWRS